MRKLHKKKQGFTLVELIIALLIIALLMSWAFPNYRDLKARRQVVDVANELVYGLTLARAEAVRYGTNVVVSPNGSWQNGWTTTSMGVDGNPDVLIARQDPVVSDIEVSQVGLLNGDVVFTALGSLTGANEGRFELKHNDVDEAQRGILISLSGSSRVVNL